jgi:hypothetical protein
MQVSWFDRLQGSWVRVAQISLGMILATGPVYGANDFCADVYKGGKFGPLKIQPAFLSIGTFNHAPSGGSYDGLVISSFFHIIRNPTGLGTVGWFERDQVARISGIGFRSPAWFNPNTDVEVLTDLDLANPVKPSAAGQTNWPNEAQRVPNGILAFEAIVVPQGFHPAGPPGRLTLINLDDPLRQEYVIDQSTQAAAACPTAPYNATNRPRFYHLVKWIDMNEDGLKDAVTVRSGFKVSGTFCIPPGGEVVWFKNPGATIDPNVEWEEHEISGYPSSTYSADISLDFYDFEGDGVPEIVANRFFAVTSPVVVPSNISIFGAPIGQSWATVNPVSNPARIKVISNDQGQPFGVQIADLNRDGRMDVLATNHQGDNCFSVTLSPVPGRVYALEQPLSGDIFNDPWVTHILKDNIRPNPTFPTPTAGPGRLAPGLAQPFWASAWNENFYRPWILVGGDEAGKVWVLKPATENANDWNYLSSTIFDINDYYGPNTTQTLGSAPAPTVGEQISTIGTPAVRYDRSWGWDSYAEVYIPVFEGRDIHRINFRPLGAAKKIVCPPDVAVACPVP